MIQRLYVVYDKMTQCVAGPVITVRHPAEAIRAFTSLIMDKQTVPGNYPTDYVLMAVGTLDDAHPSISGCEYVIIISGADIISAANTEK
nr:MAG: nonstructural protein [Microvirus sp.]